MNWKIVKQLAKYEKDGKKAGLLEELIDNFFGEFPEQMNTLKQIIKSNKAEMLEIAAHRLKGGGYTVGAQSLGDACRILEEKGRNNDLTGAENYLPEIETLAASAEQEFRQFIKELRST